MKLPRLSGQKVIKTLIKTGFEEKRQKGSHVILRKEQVVVVVPNHKEIDKGTLLEIIRQTKLSKEEFLTLLRK